MNGMDKLLGTPFSITKYRSTEPLTPLSKHLMEGLLYYTASGLLDWQLLYFIKRDEWMKVTYFTPTEAGDDSVFLQRNGGLDSTGDLKLQTDDPTDTDRLQGYWSRSEETEDTSEDTEDT